MTERSRPAGHEPNILNRLQSLEEAVFGFSGGQRGLGIETVSKTIDEAPSTPATRPPETENAQPDYATACDSVAVVSPTRSSIQNLHTTDRSIHKKVADYHNINFRFAQSSGLDGTGSAALTDELPDQFQLQDTTKCIWLPSKEGALALLDDYIQGHNLFLGIIDPQATRELVEYVYAELPQGKKIRLAEVALVLSIAATSAFFWEKDDDGLQYRFSSKFDAANWSVFWRNSTWDLLDQLRRDVTGSLEELQATCLLATLISQIEGCPSRYRRLQGNALTIAREMSLHVLDAPNSPIPWDRHPDQDSPMDWHNVGESEAVREIKRRIWWHLAGTDWLLSVMGGPLYKSYTVNPLHMRVRYPRNINDSSLQDLTPWPEDAANEWPDTRTEPPTSSTFFLLRLRVAEICYKIVDALQPIAYSRPGSAGDGIEQLPDEEIVRIAKLFEDALESFPPSCKMYTPIPTGAPPVIGLQQQITLLHFHARRARVFRPFLRYSTTSTGDRGETSSAYPSHGSRQRDTRYEEFASLCRDSARTVLTIASSLMSKFTCTDNTAAFVASGPMAGTQTRPRLSRLVHRNGLISMHLFMASVILATDPTLSSISPDAEVRRTELAQACYILKQAGETSTMASGLVRSLMIVLNRHKLRMFCNKGRPDLGQQEQEPETNPGTEPGIESQFHAARPHQPPQFLGHIPAHQQQDKPFQPVTNNFIPPSPGDGDVVNDIWAIDQIEARVRAQYNHAQHVHTQSQPSTSTQTQGQRATSQTYQEQFPSPAETDPLPLDGVWKEIMHAAAGTSIGGTGSDGMVPGGQALGHLDDVFQWDQLFSDLDYFVGPS